MKNFLLPFTILFSLTTLALFAEETPWEVPQVKADKTAPFMFEDSHVKSGEEIYLKNCKSCHGDIGQGNMNALMNPLPKDLYSEPVQAQTDGALYYKISNGRILMPKFKGILSVNDTWNVISYIRSFNKKYKQPKPATIKAYAGGALTLALNWIVDKNQLQVIAVGKKEKKETPAEGVEIELLAKRYFGSLKLGESKFTNKDGIASFNLSEKIPGDSIGKLSLIAKIVDIDKYGEVSVNGDFIAGEPTFKPGLNEERAMWNVVSKAPWWVTFAYPLVVLAVFGTIFYIALLVRRINILGKDESTNN